MAGGAVVYLGAAVVFECWAEVETAGCFSSPRCSAGLVDHNSRSSWVQLMRVEIVFADNAFVSRDAWVRTKRAKEIQLDFGEGQQFVP